MGNELKPDELHTAAERAATVLQQVAVDIESTAQLIEWHHSVTSVLDALNAALSTSASDPVGEPVARPTTPQQVRDFIGSNFASMKPALGMEDGQFLRDVPADEGDMYTLTAHDLLSAFQEWADFSGGAASAEGLSPAAGGSPAPLPQEPREAERMTDLSVERLLELVKTMPPRTMWPERRAHLNEIEAIARELRGAQEGWVMVPRIGTTVSADHPQTCLNPTPTFEVMEVRADRSGSGFAVRGENTCWFGTSMIRTSTTESADSRDPQ
jgi:hypothetical protein